MIPHQDAIRLDHYQKHARDFHHVHPQQWGVFLKARGIAAYFDNLRDAIDEHIEDHNDMARRMKEAAETMTG